MPTEIASAETMLYCGFRVGERRFGVPVFLIKEVHAPTTVTPIPHAPAEVSGYVNLRGNLYLVLDPRELLSGERAQVADHGHFIVFNALAGDSFAIRTDGVDDIVEIRADQIDVPKEETIRTSGEQGQRQRLITGHAKLEQELMTLVEPRELLDVIFGASVLQGSQST